MKTIFIIGGMGAGKSTATRALRAQGLPVVDLDKLGHEILTWEVVKDELVEEFGEDVICEDGVTIDRKTLAKKAFTSPACTRALNRITMPRIEQLYVEHMIGIEAQGAAACVVECSVFKNRSLSIAYQADVVIAILSNLETRIKRAVAAGWAEEDVRNRIAQQINDAERAEAADVIFYNDSTPEELQNDVIAWWQSYGKEL